MIDPCPGIIIIGGSHAARHVQNVHKQRKLSSDIFRENTLNTSVFGKARGETARSNRDLTQRDILRDDAFPQVKNDQFRNFNFMGQKCYSDV